MGGMAAQIPIAGDPSANEQALARVRADKEREVSAGHDGTWVAHPALIPIAQDIFDARMPAPNQLARAARGRRRQPRRRCCAAERRHHHPRRLRRQRRSLRALPRRLARWPGLRADPLADGRRRHRRDQPRAAVAVAARTAACTSTTARRSTSTLFDRALLGLPSRARPIACACPAARASTQAIALLERPHPRRGTRRVPHPARLRTTRL